MIGYNSSALGVSGGQPVPILISDFLYRSVLNLDCDGQRTAACNRYRTATRFYLCFQTEIVATEMKKAEPCLNPANSFNDASGLSGGWIDH